MRQQLLHERQNKIDTMGLAEKVADNDAVSSWNDDYRPYSVDSTEKTSQSTSYSSASNARSTSRFNADALYEAAQEALMERFDAARKQNQAWLDRQYDTIESDYTQANTATQVGARLTAQGNEEKRAALGLNMGGAYENATTGYTESARIAQNNNLKTAFNQNETARVSARASAADTAATNEANLRMQQADAANDLLLKQAAAEQSQYNADRSYALSAAGLTGYLNGTPTLEHQQYQSDLQQQALENALEKQKFEAESALSTQDAEQKAYENALARWKTYGYVLASDAAVLGVPAGTTTADQRYKTASLAKKK